jgi:hypothetical protein
VPFLGTFEVVDKVDNCTQLIENLSDEECSQEKIRIERGFISVTGSAQGLCCEQTLSAHALLERQLARRDWQEHRK